MQQRCRVDYAPVRIMPLCTRANYETDFSLKNTNKCMASRQCTFPNSKVHGANMGPTWVLSAPDGPHVGLMILAIWVVLRDGIGLSNLSNEKPDIVLREISVHCWHCTWLAGWRVIGYTIDWWEIKYVLCSTCHIIAVRHFSANNICNIATIYAYIYIYT